MPSKYRNGRHKIITVFICFVLEITISYETVLVIQKPVGVLHVTSVVQLLYNSQVAKKKLFCQAMREIFLNGLKAFLKIIYFSMNLSKP